MTTTLRYSDLKAARQASDPPQRKGERTRDRLKLSAVQVLDEVGYRDMRLSDICERAGVSPATFYLYFENKTEITTHVLSEFLTELVDLTGHSAGAATPFAAIYAANLRWLQAVQANRGLFRCVLQLGDEVPEFAALNHRVNRMWYERVARSLRRRQGGALADDAALFAAYCVGAMMDEVSRKLVVHRDPHFQDLTERFAPRAEALAEAVAVLWYRALFGRDPDDQPATEAGRAMLGR